MKHPADARRRGFMWRASEAVRFARFDDLAGLKVDEEMRKAVKDAADAWAELQAALAEREASTVSAEVVEPIRDESEDGIEPAAIGEVAYKIIRADLQAGCELYRILVAGRR